MNAEQVAKSLAANFLMKGNYDALDSGLGRKAAARYATPAAMDALNEYFVEETGFAGLAVHSVGYTKGANDEKVIIYVTRGSKKEFKELPENVEDVEIVAQVMGKIRAGPAPGMALQGIGNFYEHKGRIACGSSCAPSNQAYSGTLGALFTSGTQKFALSNNHVFAACNHTPVGMPILAPSTRDARPNRRPPTAFCNYERMEELRSGEPSLVDPMRRDTAIGRLIDPALTSSWQGDAVEGYDTPNKTSAPVSEMNVKKFGRTTGLTFGTIEAFEPAPWVLAYKSNKFSATVWFIDTWTVRSNDSDPFALEGDSGSLIVTDDGKTAVGLLFAVNNRGEYGIMMPIEDVIDWYGNVQLLSGHGV